MVSLGCRISHCLSIMVVINGVDLDDEYVVRVSSYNGTGPTGGDSLTEDLNIWYEVSCFVPESKNLPQEFVLTSVISKSGDIAWMITATALVLLMIPGVG